MSFTIKNPDSTTPSTSSAAKRSLQESQEQESEPQAQAVELVPETSTKKSRSSALAGSLLFGLKSLVTRIGKEVYEKASGVKWLPDRSKAVPKDVPKPEPPTTNIPEAESIDEAEEKLYKEKLEAMQIFVDPLTNILHFLEKNPTSGARSLDPLYALKDIITSAKKVSLGVLEKCEQTLKFLEHGEGRRFWTKPAGEEVVPAKESDSIVTDSGAKESDVKDSGSKAKESTPEPEPKNQVPSQPTTVNMDQLWAQIEAANREIGDNQEKILSLLNSLE